MDAAPSRRTVLAATVSLATAAAGCTSSVPSPRSGGNNTNTTDTGEATTTQSTQAEPATDIPDDVAAVEPLAEAYYEAVQANAAVGEPRVYIAPADDPAGADADTDADADGGDPQLVLTYRTEQSSPAALEDEFYGLAERYAEVVSDLGADPVTLTLATADVRAVVPAPAVAARAAGDLQTDAYHQTIEVMPGGRSTRTQT